MDRQADTLPKLLKSNYERWGNSKVAMRHKEFGIWQEYTWEDYYMNTKRFGNGLRYMGFERGDKLCIIGDNEPEWFWSELAAQALGGIAIGIFVDCVPEEVKYIVTHSEASFVLVRDQEQTDKILKIREEIPRVKKVIYWDPTGMWGYKDPFVMSYEEVQRLGDEYSKKYPHFSEESIEQGDTSDTAVIIYTSGTTGVPKGAMLSHSYLVTTVRQWFEIGAWRDTDNYFSYVSPAWVVEQGFGITGGLLSGAAVNFPERPETQENDMREISPSMILYSSRLWESLCSKIQIKIENGSWFKRVVFNLCLSIGYRVYDRKLARKKIGLAFRILYWLADILAFRPLRDKIGLKNTRAPYTGGALISPGTFRFFRAVGVDLMDFYGSSEGGLCACHQAGDIKHGTIGLPIPGMEVRIAKDGEMLWRGNNCLFQGYYKDPEKTENALAGGWFHSGDAGCIDEDYHIIYLDRVSDMRELKGGVKFSPQHIEGIIKFSPYIRDVIAVGGGDIPYVAALIQIDFDSVGRWAERQHMAYTTFSDLSQKPEVYNLIEKEINALNEIMPKDTQVKKFVCLPRELDPDEAELTRTRKLRRGFLEKKYRNIIDAIADGREVLVLSLEVRYRDGSVGETTTEVGIRSLF